MDRAKYRRHDCLCSLIGFPTQVLPYFIASCSNLPEPPNYHCDCLSRHCPRICQFAATKPRKIINLSAKGNKLNSAVESSRLVRLKQREQVALASQILAQNHLHL